HEARSLFLQSSLAGAVTPCLPDRVATGERLRLAAMLLDHLRVELLPGEHGEAGCPDLGALSEQAPAQGGKRSGIESEVASFRCSGGRERLVGLAVGACTWVCTRAASGERLGSALSREVECRAHVFEGHTVGAGDVTQRRAGGN